MKELEHVLRAGLRGVGIFTREERRALELVERAAADLGLDVHTYSLAAGVDGRGERLGLLDVLARLARSDDEGVWVLFDVDRGLHGEAERRALREVAQRERGPICVVIGDAGPSRLDVPELRWLTLPLPGRDELAAQLRWIGRMIEEGGESGAAERLDDGAMSLADAALGLESFALEQLVAEAVAANGRADTDAILAHLRRHKGARLDAAGLFESVAPATFEHVGGLTGYKHWLERRALALDPRARDAAIPAPRGALLVGVQGCGKSLAARATADVLGLALFRVDPGRLFAGLVGESEANLRRLLATAERLAPVVLWLDEIDKSLAGGDSGHADGGTASRVLGGLLTWLQEREAPVFVVCTANRVDVLPPELFRRGRLDETFFVDLPDEAARVEILDVHLRRRPAAASGRAPALADPPAAYFALMARAEGFSGAEIEAALIEARLDAFAEARPVAAVDLERALEATVPLSVSRAESVRNLRAWAVERARPAGGPAS